ncbi:PREDICTED: shewanella-like protein phosphatase 2 [Nicotiana attenuata]|uniref:Shewanella-like protein phosphatase 2 n=1 Tax=Nicotiana attenuata TaxID=49451 RepID=A0A314LCU2_NICAT|nr:PREDICTED: shewanella-like protein phosphatase 2 [Nicotiana attenuata]OIT38977.1 shewanella-like protein phosphatase 2 [Nicotiana attenuata]
MESQSNLTCQNLPTIFFSFVDTFVDFSVSGGLFLPPQPTITSSPNQTIFPSPNRLIAIGDLHGDFQKTKQAFKLAGLIDDHDKWCGGSTTVVQIGDVLDRGGQELKILYFLEKLKREAAKVNGNLITMNGNHEIMNVDGDFRYVTKEGLREFQDWAFWYCVGNDMKELCDGFDKGCVKDPFLGIPFEFHGVNQEFFDGIRTRIAALRPNGPISERFLGKNQTVVVVGDSVFVHGGLLTKHVDYGLENVNEEVRDWICGVRGRVSRDLVRGRNSVVWLRKFSNELEKDCDCSTLEHVLATIPGVKRMIMGHTIQESGINGVCDNQAIRIDVGMSKGCTNGLPEVLEIDRDKGLRILTSNPLYRDVKESCLDAKSRDGLGLLLPELGPKQVEVKA